MTELSQFWPSVEASVLHPIQEASKAAGSGGEERKEGVEMRDQSWSRRAGEPERQAQRLYL